MIKVWVAVLGLLLASPAVTLARDKGPPAAELFDRGTALYLKGRYAEAIEVFSEAQRLAPHPVVLFSIARCHENLGNIAQALDTYRRALAATEDRAKRAEIAARIADLERRPVNVFVSSRPLGARITVDARADPEPGVTPLVLRLPPGEHLLLLEAGGHQLAARRVVVEAGKDIPVSVTLAPPPRPAPAPSPPRAPCPRPPPPPSGPVYSRTDGTRLHFHASLMGLLAVVAGRPFAAGAGLQALGTYRRWIFGGQIQGQTTATRIITPVQVEGDKQLDRSSTNRLLVQLQSGWMFPFGSSYLYATIGIGLSYDRQKFSGWDRSGQTPIGTEVVEEDIGFAWSAGAGIEAMITPWLSVGWGLQAGMIHGPQTDSDDPTKRKTNQNAPYGMLSATASLHL